MNIEKCNAYELIERKELQDIHSVGYLLRHKKSHARVMLIENDDENKVFNIAFRTPPEDSTGVPHILEHSVLCGSREFPLKDPFVELVKGSLNTFLNAMTYSDKTVYPVASCNDQDFQNLLHVYLDAVFYPNIYQKEEIFRQEGWSYHLEAEEGPLTYNGVVYNEMKGAFSSTDDVLEREILNVLFPDTAYGVESGGDPANIPDLTYEDFLAFHKKYYHPSNSYLYLYGNMDMDEKLRFIDEKYLSAFDAQEIASCIQRQEGFAEVVEKEMSYPLSDNEEEEERTYLAYARVVADAKDMKKCLAYEILDYVLLSAPGAPVKQAILDAGIGSDVYGSFEDGILQPYFTIIAKGTEASRKEEFDSIIRTELEKVVRDGIDQKAVEAGINYLEFRYREADFSGYPKGLMYSLDILGTWLYDETNPFITVELLGHFDDLRKDLKNGYFEKLIQEGLLSNSHGCMITLIPEKGLAVKRENEVNEKLAEFLNGKTQEEKQELLRRTIELEEYQDGDEDPEAIGCIPMLKREDIRREVNPFHNTVLDLSGSLFLHHNMETNDIAYIHLLFKMSGLRNEQIPYLSLLKSILGYIDTERFSYHELFNEINCSTGGIACGVELIDQVDAEKDFVPMFGVTGKSVFDKVPFLFEMMKEILFHSDFSDTKRIKEIISQIKSRAQVALVNAGHSTSVLRAFSYTSPLSWFQEQMAGISYYWFLEDMEKNFEDRKDELVENLKKLMGQIFCKENMILSYTGKEEMLPVVREEAESLKKMLSEEPYAEMQLSPVWSVKNEGFQTSSQVQYVAQTGNFKKSGMNYTGALDILKVIMSYDYLWTNIRVKGGAYGCMSGFRRNGEGFFVSYRDPHLKRTLEVYKGIPEYLRSFEADEAELTKYIIGTISGKDVPRTPHMEGNRSRTAYLSGVTEEMLQRERDQILDASVEDIRVLADLVEAILADQQICAIGGEDKIENGKDVFGEIKPLFS